MSKKSIRFFNDREVRAVWDEEHSKWWFSATDIVRAINDEDDYKKCRNYWKYLKGKMAKDGIELVSVTNHFKFQAPDGKQRYADALDAECVQTLAINYPNVDHPVEVTGQDDAAKAQWWPIEKLPTLAFDHDDIMRDAITLFQTKVTK